MAPDFNHENRSGLYAKNRIVAPHFIYWTSHLINAIISPKLLKAVLMLAAGAPLLWRRFSSAKIL